MTITIPHEIVRQACVAPTTPYGGRWIEHDIEIIIGGETHIIAVRLEIQPEAALSREAHVARTLHAQLNAASSAIRDLQRTITGGSFMAGIAEP
jgi:hypothetical protein